MSKSKSLISAALMLGLFSATSIKATEKPAEQPNDKAKTLHDTHCLSCHNAITKGKADTLYTRENRMVKDRDALSNQVQRCEQNLGLKWFQTELDDVSAYLNTNFYKFDVTPDESTETKDKEKTK